MAWSWMAPSAWTRTCCCQYTHPTSNRCAVGSLQAAASEPRYRSICIPYTKSLQTTIAALQARTLRKPQQQLTRRGQQQLPHLSLRRPHPLLHLHLSHALRLALCQAQVRQEACDLHVPKGIHNGWQCHPQKVSATLYNRSGWQPCHPCLCTEPFTSTLYAHLQASPTAGSCPCLSPGSGRCWSWSR
jgi:hypothetical protein